MTTIKDHIEARRYPVDDKGRALVPYRHGGTVVICATDMPGGCPILGFRIDAYGNREENTSADHGWGYREDSTFLLPPPLLRAPKTIYARIVAGEIVATVWDVPLRMNAAEIARQWRADGGTVAEFTGECEVPWS